MDSAPPSPYTGAVKNPVGASGGGFPIDLILFGMIAAFLVLRLRSVAWPPPSRNRPSLVLYVHTLDEPNRAVSYSWADPAAQLIGINLRWVQASCTRGRREASPQ